METLKSWNNLWRHRKIYLLHKDDPNLLLKKPFPSIPPLKCSLWEELQTLSSHWGLVSEGEGDGMREDTATFSFYASERSRMLRCLPWKSKNLLTKREMCKGMFFFLIFIFSFWCHLSNALGEVVALKARTIQSFPSFQSIFFRNCDMWLV